MSGEDLDSDFHDLSRVLQENRLDRQQRYEEKTPSQKEIVGFRDMKSYKRRKEAEKLWRN